MKHYLFLKNYATLEEAVSHNIFLLSTALHCSLPNTFEGSHLFRVITNSVQCAYTDSMFVDEDNCIYLLFCTIFYCVCNLIRTIFFFHNYLVQVGIVLDLSLSVAMLVFPCTVLNFTSLWHYVPQLLKVKEQIMYFAMDNLKV